jgi:hypothetical protein
MHVTNERSVIISVYNRIALDVAAVSIQHVRLDQNGRFLEGISSGLNTVLTSEANLDQTARAFMQDIVMSMFDEGVVAVVPVDTTTIRKMAHMTFSPCEQVGSCLGIQNTFGSDFIMITLGFRKRLLFQKALSLSLRILYIGG